VQVRYSDSPSRKKKRLARLSTCLAAIVLIFLTLPSLIVIPLSFSGDANLKFPPDAWSVDWYVNIFSSANWRAAAIRSATVAIGTLLIATPVGLAATLAIRDLTGAWADLIRVLILLPLFVPGVLVGIGVLFLFAWLGLNNTALGLMLAHSAVALPFVVVTIAAGLTQVDRGLEIAAQSLGASPRRVLLTITLPALRTSIATAALFAFLASFDEISIAFFVSSGDSSTLPRRMFSALRDSFDPSIAAISTLLIALTTSIIATSWLLERASVALKRPAAKPYSST
jgi:putative spermidine/putrescine transport system permease protein